MQTWVALSVVLTCAVAVCLCVHVLHAAHQHVRDSAASSLGYRLVLPAAFAAVPPVMPHAYEVVLQFDNFDLAVSGRLTISLIFPTAEGTSKHRMLRRHACRCQGATSCIADLLFLG